MLNLPVYLDYNATTPCDPRVVEAMLPYFTRFYGNASSRSHTYGWQAAEAVDIAREQMAELIGCNPVEVLFTSGATEAVNMALIGAFESYASKGNHIISCNTEHKAVTDTCKFLESRGAQITWLQVDSEGMIAPEEVEAAITPETVLVSLMYANNETGTLLPVREIGMIAHRRQVLMFTDATQAVGKIPVDVHADHIDMMALSAHKFYGPKGTGALYIRRRDPRVRISPRVFGGGHERGLRSGTLNVPGIVGLGRAAVICRDEMTREAARLSFLRDRLEEGLLAIGDAEVNGSRRHRLPHVTNISFRRADSEGMMTGFNRNIAVSSGSACTSASPEPSHVLKALGLSDEMAYSSLRFSLGRFTTEEEIDFTINEVSETVKRIRKMNPV